MTIYPTVDMSRDSVGLKKKYDPSYYSRQVKGFGWLTEKCMIHVTTVVILQDMSGLGGWMVIPRNSREGLWVNLSRSVNK